MISLVKPPVVALIPARGGSKGIPKKNISMVLGKPLIAHTIEQALTSSSVDRVVVTTDDDDIAAVSVTYGAEVIRRPAAISDDYASSESALLHALHRMKKIEQYEPELVVFLQCTSPIRDLGDIDRAIAKLRTEKADSLLSVSPNHRFIWAELNGVAKSINYDYKNRPRRQDLEPQFVENGSIYVFRPWVLESFGNRLGGKLALFVMEEDASLDVDTIFDLSMVEQFMLARKDHKT